MSRESAEARLARLRRRMTLAVAVVAVIGVAGLATVTTVVDGRLRVERSDTELQGQAFRSAALVFFDDEAGDWSVEGVADDAVPQTADGILVLDGATGDVLLATAEIDDADRLVAATLRDDAEDGSLGTVRIDGNAVRAAGAPYFSETADGSAGTEVAGAVLVAARRSSDPDRVRLLAFVWGAAAALIVVASLVAWLVAGRLVRPLAAQLDREEMFLATAAHELRTPLGRFRAVTESALMTARQLPESRERELLGTDLRRLVELDADATKTVEDLLLLGRIEAGVLTSRLERVRIDRVAADLESTASELAVETSGAVEVVGDPTLLHHALSNLIVNAQRHARRRDVALVVRARVVCDGGHAVIEVTDNGPGLGGDPESLFERHSGTGISGGLGLWIVRSIVEDSGGTVTAGTDGDGGASFVIRLPIAP